MSEERRNSDFSISERMQGDSPYDHVQVSKIASDARRGKSVERDVLYSTMSETIGTRNKADGVILETLELPGEVGKSLVAFCHAVHVVLLLDCNTLVLNGEKNLSS